jgi:hypothetical protein
MKNCRIRRIAALVIAASMPLSTVKATQKDGGFGAGKDTAKVTTVSPPRFPISQSTFSVSVGGPAADESIRAQVANRLRAAVQEAKADITYADQNAKLRLFVSVDALEYSTTQSSRAVKKSSGYGKSYKEWQETHSFVTLVSTFRATYRAEDWVGNRPTLLDSEAFSKNVNAEYDLNEGQKAGTREEWRQLYLVLLLEGVRRRLVTVNEDISVLLGKADNDKLKQGNALAKAGQWKLAVDQWKAQPPFQTPKAEAYRSFNLGVAEEALGYQEYLTTRDASATLAHLAEAEKLYKQALTQKPEEKYFREGCSTWTGKQTEPPLERVQASKRKYEAIRDQQDAQRLALEATAPPPAIAVAPQGSKSLGDSKPEDAITNDDVIQFVQKKASEKFIQDSIKAAKKVAFDLSPKGRLALLDAGVSETLISFMDQQVNKKPVAPIRRKKKP